MHKKFARNLFLKKETPNIKKALKKKMSWTCGNYMADCFVGYEDRDGIPFSVYDDDCMKFHVEMCQHNLPDLCRAKCYRKGRRGSFELPLCELSCVDHFNNFQFKETGRKRLQYPQDQFKNFQSKETGQTRLQYPQCTDALQECVGSNGVVDEECVKEYEWCLGTSDEHCQLACIRTPGSGCQQQCQTHLNGFIPPLLLPGGPGRPRG